MANLLITNEDFVHMAKEGSVGILLHPCNCFCAQRNDVSVNMEIEFKTHFYSLEASKYQGLVDKLGRFESKLNSEFSDPFYISNIYTQFKIEEPSKYGSYIDYDVFKICLRKINIEYPGAVFCLPIVSNHKHAPKIAHISSILVNELSEAANIIICKA